MVFLEHIGSNRYLSQGFPNVFGHRPQILPRINLSARPAQKDDTKYRIIMTMNDVLLHNIAHHISTFSVAVVACVNIPG